MALIIVLLPLRSSPTTQVATQTQTKDTHSILQFLTASVSVGCKPTSVGLAGDDDLSKLRGNARRANSSSLVTGVETFNNQSASACMWNVPVLHEELDVLSLRFTPVNGPNVSVTHTHPTLLSYPLHTQATGGTLNLQLTLNTVSTRATEIRWL